MPHKRKGNVDRESLTRSESKQFQCDTCYAILHNRRSFMKHFKTHLCTRNVVNKLPMTATKREYDANMHEENTDMVSESKFYHKYNDYNVKLLLDVSQHQNGTV